MINRCDNRCYPGKNPFPNPVRSFIIDQRFCFVLFCFSQNKFIFRTFTFSHFPLFVTMFFNNYSVDMMSYFMIAVGIVTFFGLQFLDAPYGRYYSTQWGPSLHGKVAWFLMELPSLSIPLGTFLYNMKEISTDTCVLFLCFIAHYTNRYVLQFQLNCLIS